MNINTATVTENTPAIVLVQQADGPVTYVVFGMEAATAVDVLRRALIHLVAQIHTVQTVPMNAAVVPSANGTKPAPMPMRKKPGPKKGTPKTPRPELAHLDDDDDLDD